MEIVLNKTLLEGEVLTAISIPEAPLAKTGDQSWSLTPAADGIYHVIIDSTIVGNVYSEYLPIMDELLNKENSLILATTPTSKEKLIKADIRAITSCIAIGQFAEAQAQINIAREAWII